MNDAIEDDAPVYLADIVTSYIEGRGLDERSERMLRHIPTQYAAFLEREATTDDFDADRIREWLKYRATQVGKGSVYSDAGRMITLWKWSRRKGLCGPCEVVRGELMPDVFPESAAPAPMPREAGVDHVPTIRPKVHGCCAKSSQERPIEAGADVPLLSEFNSQTKLSVVLKRYLAVNSNIRKVRTRDSYVNLLNNLAGYLEREATIADLTDETAAAYWVWREQGVARNTVHIEACSLLAFWRWCARKHLCDDPDVTAPPKQKRRPKALSVTQMRQLFAAAINSPGDIGKVPANVFWPALLHVFWQTGERIGAVKQLKWNRIDLEGGWIEYPPETRKFGMEELVRPINADAIAALLLLKRHAPDEPFAEVRRSGFYNQFATLKSAAGLPEWVTPHTIRKSVASALPTLDDAREMLGHSNAAITARNYRDDRTRDDRALLDKLPSLTEPDKPKAKGILSRIFG